MYKEGKREKKVRSHNKCEAAILMIPFGQTTVYLHFYTERLFTRIHIRSYTIVCGYVKYFSSERIEHGQLERARGQTRWRHTENTAHIIFIVDIYYLDL